MTKELKEPREKSSKHSRSYHRVRILDPSLFTGEFKTKDVGKSGGFAILLGKLRSPRTGRSQWETQALRLEEGEWEHSPMGPVLIPVTARAQLELASLERKYGYPLAIVAKGSDWQLIPKVALHWTNLPSVFYAIQSFGMPQRDRVFPDHLEWSDVWEGEGSHHTKWVDYFVYKNTTTAYTKEE